MPKDEKTALLEEMVHSPWVSIIYGLTCGGFGHYTEEERTRGHQFKFQKIRVKTTKRQNSFFIRVTDIWNSLPDEVIQASSIISFEQRLVKHWKKKPLLYDFRACQPYVRPGTRGLLA